MKSLDLNSSFYRPVWIRAAIVGIAGGWGIFEFLTGAPFWGVLFCGAAAFAFHGLFITYRPDDDPE